MDSQLQSKTLSLGQTVITRNAIQSLQPEDVLAGLQRHARGDWGDVDKEDAKLNDLALRDGSRILSVYHEKNGIQFWIITEADRSSTTILLPEDY